MVGTRDRMVAAAVEALRRHGVAGMSFTEVLADSGAARGAIYHHFPGGKQQLIAEAGQAQAEQARTGLSALPATDAVGVVRGFLAAIRPLMDDSARGAGCAVAALAMGAESSGDDATNDELLTVADQAFRSWAAVLGERLRAAGLTRRRSEDLAATLVVILEGAHVLCRAARSVDPYDRAARAALDLVAARYPKQS